MEPNFIYEKIKEFDLENLAIKKADDYLSAWKEEEPEEFFSQIGKGKLKLTLLSVSSCVNLFLKEEYLEIKTRIECSSEEVATHHLFLDFDGNFIEEYLI